MKTLAAVLENVNNSLCVEELVTPELKYGQVLVKVVYSGVCHSQLNEVDGLKGEDKFLPHTLGHEGSGVVIEIGPDVRKVKVGDHVILTWIKGEGADVSAAQYRRRNGTIVNSGAISTFMEYTVVSENRLVVVSNDMPFKEAALLGCAIPTGVGIVINTLNVPVGSSVGIFGMGGIGLSVLLGAKINGAAKIIAFDINADKLVNAMRLGATHTVNVRDDDVLSRIMEITSGKGLDYAIECAGKRESMEMAFRSVRDAGGICVIAGNLPQGEHILINPFDLIKGKKIVGTWGGGTKPDIDIPMLVKLYLSGELRISELIGNIYNLVDINNALNDLRHGVNGRILIGMLPR
ncbi:MAG: zinc-binding dehydrogenase [Candidatus Omnitrophica bacterium]|nr:zinc-binding dehydrogenase [Candidatus Omnitrophota bacterium]